VDEGEPMRMMIADFRLSIEKQTSSSAHAQLGYTGKLLAAFTPPVIKQSTINNPKSETVEPEVRPAKSMLVEPLSQLRFWRVYRVQMYARKWNAGKKTDPCEL
jgi:hypothetical protein